MDELHLFIILNQRNINASQLRNIMKLVSSNDKRLIKFCLALLCYGKWTLKI